MHVVTSSVIRHFPDGLPDDLLAANERSLVRALEKPTLIRFPAAASAPPQPPRAIATLLHGDESTGLQALLYVLRRKRQYPFDLYVVLGNIEAANAAPGFGHRYLDGQEDFNRVWGSADPTTPQREAATAMLTELRDAGIASMVDVHNNTGNNPYYAIVTNLRADTINLATQFTSTLLHWDLGANTLMEALQHLCPAIAIECGLPGRHESLSFAIDALRRHLGTPQAATDQIERDHDLVGELRKVTVRPEVRLQFGGRLTDDLDLVLPADADSYNFVEVAAGHTLGQVHPDAPLPLRATTPTGVDVTDELVALDGDRVVTRVSTIPVMLTRTVDAVRRDCLCYFTSAIGPAAVPGPPEASTPR